MSTLNLQITVGEIVARRPALSRVFEKLGVDYCCGGKKTIEEASRMKNLDPATVLAMLEATASESGVPVPGVDASAMSLTGLVDHIEQTHHAYLWDELPRLDALTKKVSAVHGGEDPRLQDLRRIYVELRQELSSHMMKEEGILFPLIRQLDHSKHAPVSHCGTAANPIRQMELEHDGAGAALERLRDLADGYVPPEWACNSYRAMLEGLAHLERDLHQHVHKENNILFPRTLEMERRKRNPSPAKEACGDSARP